MSQSGRVGQSGGDRVIVIVGHGPSILSGLGSVIDTCTVIRLKKGLRKDPLHWGTRTDYLCGTHPFGQPGIPYWHFPPKAAHGSWQNKWHAYFASFKPGVSFKPWHPKPSTGLAAVFCAMEFLKPEALSFVGCDRLMEPSKYSGKWNESGPTCQPHDWQAEHRALRGLGIDIINLAESHGQIHRQESERRGVVG